MIESKPIKKILVAIDYSNKSLEAADYSLSIAKDINASLILIDVLEIEPWLYGKRPYEWGSKEDLDKAYHKEKEEIKRIINDISNKAEKMAIDVRTEILLTPQTKSVASAIIEYAENEKVDLIVVGTRGRSGVKKMLLGSVATGVVTYAHCPVLVVK